MNEITFANDSSGDFNVVEILATLWTKRKFIAITTFVVTVLGVVYSLIVGPVYYSQAIIAPRESDQGGGSSQLLAQLGGAAALVGSQLGVGSNGLTKLEVILKSHEVSDSVVRKNNLLPELFPSIWDSATRTWKVKDARKVPTVRKGVEYLLENVLTVSASDRKGTITVGASIHDSVLAKRIVDAYLQELGDKVRRDVTADADMNRAYLERQLSSTLDPAVAVKIQSMIAFEIEKSMLVSYQPFEVYAKPVVPYQRSSPKRKKMVVMAFILGLLGSGTSVFALRKINELKLGLVSAAKGAKA